MVSTYIREGMPAGFFGGQWHFHIDRVDKWFFDQCGARYAGKKDPEDLEENGEKNTSKKPCQEKKVS